MIEPATEPRPIRIVIAGDRQIARDRLRRVLDAEPGTEVVGEAGTGRDAVACVVEHAPDILLLTPTMPDGLGLDVLRALEGNPVRVILLTSEPDLVQALRHLRRSAAPADTLTPRERNVVAAVLAGGTNREIASALGLSEQTVKNYLSRVFDKIGVGTRLELALYAIDHAGIADTHMTPAGR